MTIVVINKTERPDMKKNSAIFSYRMLSLSLLLRIDKNDNILLTIKEMVAMAVNSSIRVVCFSFKIFNEVKTIKQSPKRLEDVFKI